jgi:hypothetical protein
VNIRTEYRKGTATSEVMRNGLAVDILDIPLIGQFNPRTLAAPNPPSPRKRFVRASDEDRRACARQTLSAQLCSVESSRRAEPTQIRVGCARVRVPKQVADVAQGETFRVEFDRERVTEPVRVHPLLNARARCESSQTVP